ncbi:hypothetical protein BDV59DRAFT_194204 [Aspergillus ambiguus]|uniref:glutaminyl-peptide cyclotransferase family protein n=1 Tax=Aspergillus ambiguus TaxID=176160 RepID=UPI003CCC8F57
MVLLRCVQGIVSTLVLISVCLIGAYKTVSDDTLRRLPRPGLDFDIYHGPILAPILRTRVPGTPGAEAVRDHFVNFFRSSLPEWKIELHNFTAQTPVSNNREISFTNFIAFRDPPGINEGDTARLTLVAHADSKLKPTGFIGAIDSAAPCAIIMHAVRSIYIALTRKWSSEAYPSNDTHGIQVIFTDGEERFSDDSSNLVDDLYGSRTLAADWEMQEYPPTARYPNRLASISLFVLLDLLGTSEPVIASNYNTTHWVYKNIARLEARLRQLGQFKSISTKKDTSAVRSWFIDSDREARPGHIVDDHVPFYSRGVKILHIIDYDPFRGFPGVWHTLDDDGQHLDLAAVEDWSLLMTAFLAEWLHLEGYMDD